MVWEKDDGWKAAIRPGAKQLLANLSRYYELVIFTSAPGYLGEPVAAVIDPYQYATYRLYRDHTKIEDGNFVKDLSVLNRDLSTVIMVDINPESYKLQPENGIAIKSWTGDENDKEMFRFETFLEEFFLLTQVMGGAADVRPLLDTLKKIDAEDLPRAWQLHKDKVYKTNTVACRVCQTPGCSQSRAFRGNCHEHNCDQRHEYTGQTGWQGHNESAARLGAFVGRQVAQFGGHN
jgi:mitochondrial import inner membrane translocase subunit TIM50